MLDLTSLLIFCIHLVKHSNLPFKKDIDLDQVDISYSLFNLFQWYLNLIVLACSLFNQFSIKPRYVHSIICHEKRPSAFDSELKLIQVVTYKQLVWMLKAKRRTKQTQVNDILVMIVDEKRKKTERKKHPIWLVACH
jgi:hypothetical protein